MGNKDIDKAAREYAEEYHSYAPFATESSFRDGAKWMKSQMQSEIDELVEALEEATSWVPVSERLPEIGTLVNLKGYDGEDEDEDEDEAYDIGYLHTGSSRIFVCGLLTETTHWRPIDTPKATQLLEKYGKK